MVSPVFQNIYNVSREVESNSALNRGMMDLFGLNIPWAIMANNKYERRERLIKSMSYLVIAFLTPFITLPLSNRIAARTVGLTNKAFGDKEHKIIHLSNKYLKSDQDMLKGLKELGESLKINFEQAEKLLKNNPQYLRSKIVKAKTGIFAIDFILTGVMLASVGFLLNEYMKKLTGRTGFTAEFNMASQEYTSKKAEKHESIKWKKFGSVTGLVTLTGIGSALGITKGLLNPNSKGISRFLREKAEMFDYTKGIYVKRLPLFLMFLTGIQVGLFLSARDSHERKDTIIRSGTVDISFFLLEPLLNGIVGRFFDKQHGTTLMQTAPLTKLIEVVQPNEKRAALLNLIFPKTYTMHDLEKLIHRAQESDNIPLLEKFTKTKKYALGMYWGNLIASMLFLGFGTPAIINKITKKDVKAGEKTMLNHGKSNNSPPAVQPAKSSTA